MYMYYICEVLSEVIKYFRIEMIDGCKLFYMYFIYLVGLFLQFFYFRFILIYLYVVNMILDIIVV